MINDILNLIADHKYSDAYELTKQQKTLPKIYYVWTQIYDGQIFDTIDRNINFENFDVEIIETVKLYIRLSESNWDKELLAEFRRVAKMIIAEISSELRDTTHTNINGQIIHNADFYINPEIRNCLQELIEHFEIMELHESKADLARVKAQLTLTMNLEKRYIGSDMLQYGQLYEYVKQYEDSIQIYYGVIHDFEQALDISYEDKKEQLFELDILRQAYEGVFRLTENADIQQKLNKLNVLVSKLQNQSESKQSVIKAKNNHVEEKKSWFRKIFGN